MQLSLLTLTLAALAPSVYAVERASAFTTWNVPNCDINHVPGAVRTSHLIDSDVCFGNSDVSLQVDPFRPGFPNCRLVFFTNPGCTGSNTTYGPSDVGFPRCFDISGKASYETIC